MFPTPIATIDALESRRLLSSGTLLIEGTNASDTITAAVKLNSSGVKVLHTQFNGVPHDYDLTGIHRLEINGLSGNDQILIDSGTVRGFAINGGPGDDTIHGGSGNDSIIGGAGNDSMQGGDGDDVIKGYDGRDVLLGNNGNDTMDGGTGNDSMFGQDGNDLIVGGTGTDSLQGQDGDDTIYSRDHEFNVVIGGSGTNTGQKDSTDNVSEIDIFLP